MFSSGPNYNKLKTNLNLVTKRLKMLEKKKTELSQKSRKEIADYLKTRSVERARIKVEQIIREDYLVEAMEIIEMYCDLLIARFGIIQQVKTLDEGLAEAISSIIWAAPHLQADVAELQIIADQLTMKYGKPYGQACRDNAIATVSPKLRQKLGVQAPPRYIVEKYLVEIAKHYGVEYEPEVVDSGELINFGDGHTNDLGGGGWSAPPQPGFKVSNYPEMPSIGQPVPMPPVGYKPFNYPSLQPVAPAAPSQGNVPIPSSAPYFLHLEPSSLTYMDQKPSQSTGTHFDLPPPYTSPLQNEKSNVLPPYSQDGYNIQQTNEPKPMPRSKISSIPPKSDSEDFLDLPPVPFDDLPSIDNNGKENEEEIDFDELTKRFEELKKRKN